MEKMVVRGVAKDENVARISLVDIPDHPGIAYRVFALLAAKRVNVDIILQSIGRDGSQDISFTVPSTDKDLAVEVLNEQLDILGAKRVVAVDNIAKVSIVGAGMQSNPGVAAQMFEALSNEGINIQMISTSEIKISVLIDRPDADRAVNAIHRAFALND